MPNSSLLRLVYASRRTADRSSDPDLEVRDILMKSIPANRERAVTGLLVASDDWFLQALEGPREAVQETFERICLDPRHTQATLRETVAGQPRLFPRWTMCARVMSSADEAIMRRLVNASAFDPFAVPPQAALGLLTSVADLHDQLLTTMYADLNGEVLSAA